MTASVDAPSAEPVGSGTLEETQVRAMFDRIAGLYDRMNTVMTAGLHHQWRRRAADLAPLAPGARALDVATGHRRPRVRARRGGSAPGGEVVGTDFSERMLEIAREKAAGAGPSAAVSLRVGQRARAARTATATFDAATVGFGARNFSDLERGLREMARVVRPGGRVVVLEITTPQRPPLSTLLSSCGSIASCRRSGGSPAIRRPTATCRTRSGASRARRSCAAMMARCGLERIRYC